MATTASLLQTRNVIEGLAVRLFVPKRTDDDIAVLRTIIRDFRQVYSFTSDDGGFYDRIGIAVPRQAYHQKNLSQSRKLSAR